MTAVAARRAMATHPFSMVELFALILAFSTTIHVTIAASSALSSSNSRFDFVGCYLGSQTRLSILETFQLSTSGSALTTAEIDSCVADCTASGSAYVALQNGQLCYCSSGYPVTAQTDTTDCDTPCASTDPASSGCGGVFLNALYQVANDTTSCFNGKQDANEEGVDCGGRCAEPCDLVQDGGFEHIYDLARGASKEITESDLASKSAWSGAGGEIATSGAPFGNGQVAPEGSYYFGFFAGTTLAQTVTTQPGYVYQLSWFASSTSSDKTFLVVSQGTEILDNVTVLDHFDAYAMEVEVFDRSISLSFQCVSEQSTEACLIDDVNMTTVQRCNDIDADTISFYSDKKFSTCDDVLTLTKGSYQCNQDINDMLNPPIPALAVPDQYCCSSCAVEEQISADKVPSDEYPFCAKEGDS